MPLAHITVPSSSVLSMGTGAQTNQTVAAATGPSTGVAENGWAPVFSVAGPNGLLVGFRNQASGFFTPLGRGARQLTRAQYEQQQRQQNSPIGNPRGDRKPRPVRGGAGGGGGGGGGGVPSFPGVAFTGAGGTRVDQLRGVLANPPAGFQRPDGTLSEQAQASLVEGLDASDFTAEVLAYLDNGTSINFLIYDDGQGTILYVDARLETPQSLALLSYRTAMNYPTAAQLLDLGYAISRLAWFESGVATKMLMIRGDVIQIGSEGSWEIVTSERGDTDPNVTAADLLATDWVGIGAAPEVGPVADLVLVA